MLCLQLWTTTVRLARIRNAIFSVQCCCIMSREGAWRRMFIPRAAPRSLTVWSQCSATVTSVWVIQRERDSRCFIGQGPNKLNQQTFHRLHSNSIIMSMVRSASALDLRTPNIIQDIRMYDAAMVYGWYRIDMVNMRRISPYVFRCCAHVAM